MKKSFLKLAAVLGVVATVLMSTKCDDDPKPTTTNPVVTKDTNKYIGDTVLLQLNKTTRIIDKVNKDTIYVQVKHIEDQRCDLNTMCEEDYIFTTIDIIYNHKKDTTKNRLIDTYADHGIEYLLPVDTNYIYRTNPDYIYCNRYNCYMTSIFPLRSQSNQIPDEDYKLYFRFIYKK